MYKPLCLTFFLALNLYDGYRDGDVICNRRRRIKGFKGYNTSKDEKNRHVQKTLLRQKYYTTYLGRLYSSIQCYFPKINIKQNTTNHKNCLLFFLYTFKAN